MRIIDKLPTTRWEDYRDLRLQALKESPQAFLSDYEASLIIPKDKWIEKIRGMIFAEQDGRLVGMIGYYQEGRVKINHIANIVSFYVVPDFRGKGVGKQLFSRALTVIRSIPKIKKIQLGVVTNQPTALKIYSTAGFENVGTLRKALKIKGKYYDERLMELLLD